MLRPLILTAGQLVGSITAMTPFRSDATLVDIDQVHHFLGTTVREPTCFRRSKR
jgi:hypothetical protein